MTPCCSRSVESASPLVMVNLRDKGIALESPSRKSKKKKRKLVKASEGEPKRTKLMASIMSEAKIVEIMAKSSTTLPLPCPDP